MLLHSAPLGDAIRAIRLKESVQLEGDHAYIAMCMKLPLPLLPEYTPRQSFVSYIESMDFDKMAMEWGQPTAQTSCRYSLHIYAATLPCGSEASGYTMPWTKRSRELLHLPI